MPALVTRPTYPRAPYPEDVPTHPLLIVDYLAVEAGDEAAIDVLFKACSTLGFFYLANTELDAEPIFAVGEDTFDLPQDYLDSFEQGDSGMSAGYKKAGLNNVDALGNLDTAHFINVNKHDVLNFPEVFQRTYPSTVMDKMTSTIQPFVRSANDILLTLMARLEPRLGLPVGTLAKLHTDRDLSGSEVRVISKPAQGEKGFLAEGKGENGEPAAAIGAHTDFGSFSMLFGRGTGGLQVLTPGSKEWANIKPLKGHQVCNVGDTLAIYSGGIFKSNIHRVIPPPAPQDKYTRWSAVFFIRPTFEAKLYPMSDLSPQIAEAAAKDPVMSTLATDLTAGGWFKRRIAGQRVANKGWNASRGTEHSPAVN